MPGKLAKASATGIRAIEPFWMAFSLHDRKTPGDCSTYFTSSKSVRDSQVHLGCNGSCKALDGYSSVEKHNFHELRRGNS
jgi:hypothetical protein